MFRKLVLIEPVSLVPSAQAELHRYANEIIQYPDIPSDSEEIIRRIGDADAVLLSYTSRIEREVLEACPSIRYIGMCCSYYSPESANVDIPYAEAHGITVLGIRDYGDRGVVEFVDSELIRFLHGYDRPMYYDHPSELTDFPIGIIGLGTSGSLIAQSLLTFHAKVSYYSRTRKPAMEAQGIRYLDLHSLLASNAAIITCLNKNVVLLHDEQFQALGTNKLLINTSIGPSHDLSSLKTWLSQSETNRFICDTLGASGLDLETARTFPNLYCANASSGMTIQAYQLLSEKVLSNLRSFLQSSNDLPM